ncbi:putative exocyst complex component Exo70, cullin repeat-like-containing domain superfamily [Helianthus annuus]|uniref:Exocyst subunit Exo70 family protein n=1 Tax=Helianthus annuus TaxID=4232 RepID=A0A251SUU4_HELAN|nr:exocyst complex component EXO70A1 [Helianthus annuus]KAF5774371.1 putative exocyst complex component Exo70, cullin repeat-like-containing domain superfamily [Helianthus annuus]KAJ0477730.1 putative exocyst complex component Exo70, cullin repeat-like-containing domain superfamily [Helianthus annuus]KAJ0482285.1 putative exocyst complex component Exo70, cullin repeat-like-containing domain superfamily [Helianthus annuus]KAJ0498562.1 putative exocyst complex component Exo70, cullin repeat-like-
MGSLGEDDLIMNITNLISMKNSLKLNLEKSKTLGLALQQSEPRLEQINQRLPRLESAVRPIGAQPDALDTVSGHINKAVVPAAAVLKVFDAIHGLEKSLSDPKSDLSGYLKVLGNLRGAVKFLSDNCGMAVEWLGDIVEYLEDYNVADKRYISSLKNAITLLKDLQHEEKGCFDGGLLAVSLDRLEGEFRRLLTENSVPLPMSSSPLKDEQPCISPSPLPVPVIKKLQDIIGSLIVNNRLERCKSIYVDVRSSIVRASLRALNLEYLEISVSEFNDVNSIQGYITKWSEHLEFAVKHLFEAEYKLCNDVFEKLGLDVWRDCFANIAAQAGMLAFLQFGKTVTESKKDPIKLLKLLDIFAALNRLRLDFNRLFGGAACAEIQNLTRDLIKSLIEGASEIFWELLLQVELQRQSPPPPDGSVPRLVSFITEYSNRLLGNDYKPILNQVLAIERSWKREKFHERLVHDELLNLIRAVELNLDTWSKAYNDAHLSFVFLMNNHWHLYKHLNATTIGALLGDQWLRGHQEETEYYSTILLKESWGKLPSHLSREGLILFSGGRATARDLVKKRLKAFNEAFDNIYQKNSKWVILDKDLREKTLQVIIQTIVPVYRSYMQNYGPLVEQDLNAGKYVKFTAQSLEKTISSLFLPKPVRHGSFKVRQRSRKFSNGVEEQLSASPTPTIASA